MSVHCSVYGLQICASGPIPGLVSSEATVAADVTVQLGFLPRWFEDACSTKARSWYVSAEHDAAGEPNLRVWKLASGDFHVRYPDGTEFVVDRLGTSVWTTWPDTLTLEDTATYLLGPIMGFVLLLRGTISLHASAIAVGNEVIALVGPAGTGKSTTAAAFADLGHRVISDDVLTLDDRGESILAQPAYPRLRLWPASVKLLYGSEDALPRLTPTWEKCYLDLNQNGHRFHQSPLPLGGIYVLSERSTDEAAPFVDGFAPNEAMLSLIANTYATNLMDKEMRAREFRLLNRVLSNVPMRRVVPHSGPAYLRRMCEVIVEDFQALKSRDRASLPDNQGLYV